MSAGAQREAARVQAVGLGEAAVGGEGDELVAYGLGSCIALALWSPARRRGALCHVVLPDSGGRPVEPGTPARYGDAAVAWALRALGGPAGLVAKLAGGARILDMPAIGDIGQMNARAVRAALQAAGVAVQAEDVGGSRGRTVRFSPASGLFEVRRAGGEVVRL